MSVHKRGEHWYINFRFGYNRYRRKSPEDTRAGALAYESSLRLRLARGEDIEVEIKKVEPVLFRDFAERWYKTYVLTNNKYSEQVTKRSVLDYRLIPFFGKKTLQEISALSIEDFKARVVKEVSNKTVNNYLTVLRRCLRSAEEWGLLKKVPMIRLLKVPPVETVYLTVSELSSLLNVVDDQWREIIFTFIKTGMRFGELIALQWQDIDFDHKVITVQRSISRGRIGSPKSNKIRKIPMAGDLELLFTMKDHSTAFVFVDGRGEVLKQKGCDKKILRFGVQAGIEKRVTWHVLRHSFATHLANNGTAIPIVQALLGHSDVRTTMRYAHVIPVSLVEAIKTLPDYSLPRWTQGGHKVENEELSLESVVELSEQN
jgi:integrase